MRESIKAVKGFQPREPIKGHMVNMFKGLKLNEEIFGGPKLIKLSGFASDHRLACHKGEHSVLGISHLLENILKSVKHSFTSSKKK